MIFIGLKFIRHKTFKDQPDC